MAAPLPRHRAREYETIFIISPDATMETIDQIAGRVTDVIDTREGKLLKAENWGKRRLAYPVAKNRQGYYIYLRYLGYSDMVHEIERNFRMLEPVIKYLTVKVDEDVNPDARPVQEGDISFVPHIEEEREEDSVDESDRDLSDSDDDDDDYGDNAVDDDEDDSSDDEDDEADEETSHLRRDSTDESETDDDDDDADDADDDGEPEKEEG